MFADTERSHTHTRLTPQTNPHTHTTPCACTHMSNLCTYRHLHALLQHSTEHTRARDRTTCNLNTSFWARHGLHGVEKQRKLEGSVADCSLLQHSLGSASFTRPEALNTLQVSPRAIELPPLTPPTDPPREHASMQSSRLVPGTIAERTSVRPQWQLQLMLLMDNSLIGRDAFRQPSPTSPAYCDSDGPPEGRHSERWQSHVVEDSEYMGQG